MRAAAITAVLLVVAAACGGSNENTADDGTASDGTVGNGTVGDTAATSSAAGGGDQAAAEPALVPGEVATGVVTLDGQTVDYVTVTPAGFERGDSAPVMVAFPPGGQDPDLTRSVVEQTYRDEALARGWVVVSPAAPRGGPAWFDASEGLSSALLDWIEGWVAPEGGAFHIVGVSNGGLSTFRVAGDQPDRVKSIVAFPGYPRSDDDREALDGLTGVPVRMFVGSEDPAWITPMEETETTLQELGGDVELEVMPDEGHIMASLSDGVRIFDELDAAR